MYLIDLFANSVKIGEIKKELNCSNSLILFVIPERLERSTHSLEGCCSIQLSYGTFFRLQNYTIFQFLQLYFLLIVLFY
jgi:hypothetical protein